MTRIVDPISQEAVARRADRRSRLQHPLLKARTPQQIDAWIDGSVSDIDDVKRVLKLLTKQILLKG